jgi:Membrane protein involved in the export of O-antigen and teichoic acid
MAGRFIGFIVAFAIPLVLARVFSQNDFGSYKQLFLVFATLFGIAQAGMAESLYYFLPDEEKNAGAYVCNSLLLLAGVGALVALGLWFGREWTAQLLNNAALAQYLPWVAAYLLLMLIAVVMEIIMTVRREHFLASSSYALTDVFRALLSIAPVLLLADLYWLMWGTVLFALLRCLAALYYVVQRFGSTLRPSMPALRRQLWYAVPFGIAAVIEIAQVNFHMYAVSYAFDPVTFAIYAVGCLQIPLVDFLMTSTCNVMMVNMREKARAGDMRAVMAIWLESVRKLSFIFFPLVGLLLVTASDLIVFLFTDAYRASVPVFTVWSVSMLFMALLTDGTLRVFADTRFLIVQNLLRLGIIVLLIQWFLQRFDLIGAILVTLVATAVAKTFALWRIKHLLKVSFAQVLPWKDLAHVLLIASVALIPASLPQLLQDAPILLRLVLSSGLYVLTYYVLLLGIGPLQLDERLLLKSYMRSALLRLQRGVVKATA